MEDNGLRDLERLCAHVEDPRMERNTRHRVWENSMIAMCGAEGWVDSEVCGKAQAVFLTDLLDVPHG